MRQELELVVGGAVKELFGIDVVVDLTRPETQFGDYATNVALQLAKQIGKNPREIAEALAAHVRERSSHIGEVEVAGPGFLNLTLTDDSLFDFLNQDASKPLIGQKILVEYSDPNPFKPLHAGHLYTTLVGDTIARLVERAGAQTIRLNFGGDVGLHVGKSMWAIIRELGGEDAAKLTEVPKASRAEWLGVRYVEGNRAYEESAIAKQEILAANKRVYELHVANDHVSAFAQIYWECRDWSYKYFKTLYDQLQIIRFDRFIPESEVTPVGVEEVKLGLERGVYDMSDRAVVYRGDEGRGLHTRVFINSDGLPTYETKDVGLSLVKWNDYAFDKSIIITDVSQTQYMQVVLAAIHELAPKPAERTIHITHGRVRLMGGVKISSRKGNGPSAIDILEAARAAGKAAGTNSTEETILAAVKYAFAKVRVGGDIVYNPNESIALEGNSGPYLQYAYARARSILAKSQALNLNDQTNSKFQIPNSKFEPDERLLARKLTEYPEVLEKATAELMPHHICTYLYELAQEFNRFYEKNRVIGDDRELLRLYLVEAYSDTLKLGLELLGIHAPERM